MSALVDIWTGELAKLREKGQTIWGNDNGSSHDNIINAVKSSSSSSISQAVEAKEHSNNFPNVGKVSAFIREMRSRSLVLPYFEASVSMLIDFFSA
ncbi:hypothetical protein CICLE_v10029668mg [Citrus x clementina]|uniref:Uncharacterized protein n=1 Tax=Citrus clementina TaxID=85681 RepID=V4SHB8_CITCL|nr:hypothetical protein CICLE_v10029668mg [Citrus x clementina]